MADAPRQSSLVKVATFVASVGEGGKFTKLNLLEAVPGVAQADRRMRDLRSMGWVIDNYKINPNLSPDQYLLRTIGTRVDLGEKPTGQRKTITGAKRRRILDRDGHVCQSCFTAGGEEFADAPGRRATLTIGHIEPVARGGSDDDSNLRAECQRCNDEARDNTDNPPDPDEVLTQASRGSRKDKRELYLWMQQNRRSISDREQLFIKWRRLPADQRERVMNALAAQVITEEG
ncbi:HNH endonuclease [Microbacterium sp. M28]|uniref:HNH endonuclease n=1 Tax=Microbacterium sp. M28 TaxID=2962064 RepID=UPI0021F4348A|nr:HNH endonuclease [Microbacterium sp. M28]UYO96051.1 HNH endonuclease [Microbacterium sp. M28]